MVKISTKQTKDLSVVIQLKQRGRHQLVVPENNELNKNKWTKLSDNNQPWHSEVSLLLELDQEQLAVFLGLRDVGRNVRVLGRLEVRPPPGKGKGDGNKAFCQNTGLICIGRSVNGHRDTEAAV